MERREREKRVGKEMKGEEESRGRSGGGKGIVVDRRGEETVE